MSEEQDPFELMVRATLAESDQEPFKAMMRRMCAAALREMHPHVVEAEQAAKQARAEMFCQQQGAGPVGGPVYVREPFQPTPEEIAEWRRKEEEQRKAYEEQQRKEHRKQLRDAFAMAALTGLLAEGWTGELGREKRAANAWAEADAMLKARGDE